MAIADIFKRAFKTNVLQYAIALLAVAVALLIRGAMHSVLGDSIPYVILLPAVAFSAWYCGVGPSVAGIVVALAGAKYWFIPPQHSFGRPSLAHLIGMLAFLLASACVVALGETRRRENTTLRRAQGALEERVKERTAELDRANQSLRKLTARLLQLQDDERRRFARELHDSVGQVLAALSINLSTVRGDLERLAKTAAALTDSEALVQEMSKEVRTVSHLLYPPMLDEAGLASALRWYTRGFAERSKIEVELDVPADFGRFSPELETAVFRVVQECLTNIHRHARSPIAKVRIDHTHDRLVIEVEDRGAGIPREKLAEMESDGLPGVGIRGMRERLRQLGGDLGVYANNPGTIIRAHIPVAASSSTAAA